MSVTLAPRALMEEKAAWPGVSRKVIFSPEGSWTEGQRQAKLSLWSCCSDHVTEAPPAYPGRRRCAA